MTGPDAEGNLYLELGPFNAPEQQINTLDFVIHYLDGSWDNNNGQDYVIDLSGGEGGTFVIDGSLDAEAELISSSGDLSLYAAFSATELYVAANAAPGLGQDVFIFISDSPGNMSAAPWAKSGSVAAWDVYLANESTNGWCGWFDQSAVAQSQQGSVLEGVISLSQWNSPEQLYICLAAYQTPNNGTLQQQAPAGNGNGNIEAVEYLQYVFDSGFLYGDIDGNGLVESYDAALILQYFTGMITNWEEWQLTAADVDGNGFAEAYDASLILRFTVNMIDHFPVEE
jgi:hypothetical protein